ncbi:MAG: hypothetical protein IIW79_04175 [Clostridia bacterium]|nr:hypothetical protein [Clostridia bacterium]
MAERSEVGRIVFLPPRPIRTTFPRLSLYKKITRPPKRTGDSEYLVFD